MNENILRLIAENSRLQQNSLNLAFCRIDDNALIEIVDKLVSHTWLISLNLAKNQIKNLNPLIKLPWLTRISLDKNQICLILTDFGGSPKSVH
jgi:Leucine-rich repeat (LRR) protein